MEGVCSARDSAGAQASFDALMMTLPEEAAPRRVKTLWAMGCSKILTGTPEVGALRLFRVWISSKIHFVRADQGRCCSVEPLVAVVVAARVLPWRRRRGDDLLPSWFCISSSSHALGFIAESTTDSTMMLATKAS